MNEVNLTGRLGQDPLFWPGESPRAAFTIAVENRTETPDWIPVTVFGGQAEVVAQHLGKGRKVAVTGRLNAYRSLIGDQNVTRISVVARNVEFLDFPKDRHTEGPALSDEDFVGVTEAPEELEAF